MAKAGSGEAETETSIRKDGRMLRDSARRSEGWPGVERDDDAAPSASFRASQIPLIYSKNDQTSDICSPKLPGKFARPPYLINIQIGNNPFPRESCA